MRAIALIPARSGSERVPGKNVRLLAGHPLIAYAIAAARGAAAFEAIVVSTDSEQIAEIARSYGADVPALRPTAISTSTSPDIEWVLHMIELVEARQGRFDVFAIVRPTSPFRSAETIRRGLATLLALDGRADSIRAVERCKQHPGKMWTLDGELLQPLLPQPESETPLHSRQYQALPPVYVQNSSLEIAWRHVLDGPLPTISGRRVAPFFTDEVEGFSLDYPEDFERAERLLAEGGAQLPRIEAAV
jgi:N-acylneuraminate cytidylyltransferase